MKSRYLIILFLAFSCSGEMEEKETVAIIIPPVVVEKVVAKKPDPVKKICQKPEYKKSDQKILWNIGKQQILIEKLIKESKKKPKTIYKTIYKDKKCPVLPKLGNKLPISQILRGKGIKLDTHYGIDNKCRGWVWVIREKSYDHYYFVDCNGNYVEQFIKR